MTALCETVLLSQSGLHPSSRETIWRALLQESDHDQSKDQGVEAFFAYYAEQCHVALVDRGRHCSARTHQDIIDVTARISRAETYESILATLRDRYEDRDPPVDDAKIRSAVCLAASILSMHCIDGALSSQDSQTRLLWSTGSLQQCLLDWHSRTSSVKQDRRLEPTFNVLNLEKIANIRVVWTSNLADHLRLRDFGIDGLVEVNIFHHATYLQAMQRSNMKSLYPTHLLEETLATLALLFPYKDPRIGKWFRKKVSASELIDRGVLACWPSSGPVGRQLSAFPYWQERLYILKQAFDDSEPGTIKQWAFDRRRKIQWATFWTAVAVLVLTIVFGVIQSIEGGLQAWKAFHP